ncbi:N-acyl-L-homoserine lactone synthetase [Jannaschia sp. S6380]|uniref:acyl-homoserine-lactone synthase n=1 Tax=Jannaschia sp. S6380 TaxID=2926408 RepID=UPI001FF3B7BA|nr:acyl-homoserine-lactone synthase [Jannaschia sp. S6380]MCK0165959.1 N-acyl-L-homoserine lactone synthetase [Jannaschia sp. S6380]
MQVTTLSFDNLHAHGSLFADLLRARHRTFIEQAKWDLPAADGMEFDQYDTPASRWVAVHDGGRILAGVRLTPTTHRCGIYSYMIRDAQRGLLETIPSTLLFDAAPVAPDVWESSRVFVCHDVPARLRMRVQMQLISRMVESGRALGASRVLGLIPANSPRLARRVGLDCVPAGPVMDIGGSDSVCVNISMATKMH